MPCAASAARRSLGRRSVTHASRWDLHVGTTEGAEALLVELIEQVFELRSTRPRKRRAALTVDGASSISDARLPVNADESEGEGLDSPDESEREASGQDF